MTTTHTTTSIISATARVYCDADSDPQNPGWVLGYDVPMDDEWQHLTEYLEAGSRAEAVAEAEEFLARNEWAR